MTRIIIIIIITIISMSAKVNKELFARRVLGATQFSVPTRQARCVQEAAARQEVVEKSENNALVLEWFYTGKTSFDDLIILKKIQF